MFATTLALLAAPFEDAPAGGSAFASLFPFLAIGVLFYFMLIVPERKRRNAREEMLASLEKDVEIMTTGGLYGTITKVDGDVVTLRIADQVRIRIAKSSIQGLVGSDGAPPQPN